MDSISSSNSSETEIKKDGIIYHLNLDNKTAGVFGSCLNNIIIPRSVTYQSQDFIVTSILKKSFKMNETISSVQFSPDSELQTIEAKAFKSSNITTIKIPSHTTKICEGSFQFCFKLLFFEIPMDSKLQTIERKAFYCSTFESISIPSDILELKKGWCDSISKSIHINIIPRDKENIKCIENGIIIGKSEISSDIYDILLFVPRNVKQVEIPSNIKIIGSYAFDQSIIEEIIIPSEVTTICEGAFAGCENLHCIEIPFDSKLQMIEENAFYCSTIEKFSIPSDILEFKKNWCFETSHLNNINIIPRDKENIKCIESGVIIGKSDISSDVYDILLFVPRNVKKVEIPSNIKIIGSYSFDQTSIEEIIIPSEVTTFYEGSFYFCEKLHRIEIPYDSKLQLIEKDAFISSAIESIFIPSNVTRICKETFKFCEHLRKVEIGQDSKLQIIEKEAFGSSQIEKIFIPQSVELIDEKAFESCKKLRYVEMAQNSKLQKIEKGAFSYSSIRSIFITSEFIKIDKDAFSNCYDLQIVEINVKCEIQSIEINGIFCDNFILMISSD